MENFLWVEEYRPKDVSSCILPKNLKDTFTEFVESETIPNLILSGGPGVGKTTIAKAMIEQIGATYMMINGSEESGIDVLRTKIKNFAIPKSEKQNLASEFFKRVISILDIEEVKYDKRVIAEVINNHFPDWRRTLNELQRYAISGSIDAGMLVNIGDVNIKELMAGMKNKEFTNVRKWVEYVDGSTIPHCVVVLGEYQYKSAFVADQEINMMACLTEIMARAKFK